LPNTRSKGVLDEARMRLERSFRGSSEAAFDWHQAARELDVPLEIARDLYLRAMRRATDLGVEYARQLYLRWLHGTAQARRTAEPPPRPPGRLTLAMHESGAARRVQQSRDLERLGPGKWTRSLLEAAGDEEAALPDSPPGFDEVQLAMRGLLSGAEQVPHGATEDAVGAAAPSREGAASARAQALREQLLAAAANGRGAVRALGSTDPTTAAAALRELRSETLPGQTTPVLQLVARADDGDAGRALGRGSVGTALPADLVARLAPHVGPDAADAARLHTDEVADIVAAAHHARAVALGDAIYFARGQYAPGTEHGDELLTHELTHVAQARRGELTRAAAKGIDGGGELDRSEAEADLRAKLAVFALHPPQAVVPPPAPPSGQPVSTGARANKLAGQQQRLALAGQSAPLAPVAAPAPSKPQEPADNPPLEMPAAPAPAPTANAYLDALAAPPSKQALELWGKAGTEATTQVAADQTQFDAALPPLPVALGGGGSPSAKSGATPGPATPVAGKPSVEGNTIAAGGNTIAAGGNATAPGGNTAGDGNAAVLDGQTPTRSTPKVTPPATGATPAAPPPPIVDKEQLKANAEKAIDALPTTAPDVATHPGTAPVVDLSGPSDPVRAMREHKQAVGEGSKALAGSKARIIGGPGAAQVQPVKLDEKLVVPKQQPAGEMPALPAVEGMAEFKDWNLPKEVQDKFNEIASAKTTAHLSDARSKVTQAEATRDVERSRAVDDAHHKVKQAHTDADQQQQAKVAQSRTQITNHQAETLRKQDAEVAKLDKQAGAKKAATIDDIKREVSGAHSTVDGNYKTAQKQAEDKKQAGEEEAARKKQEAEDKKKDKSWLESVGDAICDAIQSIADAITSILDEIGKAIGALFDAVKNAACQLIDAACSFVCEALGAFGDWLKSAVTALVGSVFPELAEALNRFIDQAVSAAKDAVKAIGDGLKKAVSALCDTLKAAIDTVISAYKAAVQVAATLAKALVTGDWAAAARMVLDGVLRLLGIDPAAFYALIGKAMDSIGKIVENPGGFVGNLIDAVKLGFQQFATNFWTHLKSGIVQWLFGTVAEAGITMPATFDIAGIFDLVCQVLGLTWSRLRGKVAKQVGEQNAERLGFVEKYLQAMISGGFGGLWQQVQQDMSGLWDMVIGGVRDWLIEKVVTQAVLKIATMWNPAGAIVQLIMTAWNVFCWVRENAQRIFGLIQAVVDSIANIVGGNIGGAASYIEASLGKLVPIAISLCANLLGLGGIAGKIKSIIEKVQAKIDQAIDKLIGRVKGRFKGKPGAGASKTGAGASKTGASASKSGKDNKNKGKDKAKDDKKNDKKKGAVGARITFQALGETHTQYIEIANGKPVAMVASTPSAVKSKIDEWRPRLQQLSKEEKQRAGKLIGKAIAIEGKVAELAAKAKPGEKNAALEAKQRELAGTLAELWEVMAPDLDASKPFSEQDPRATLRSAQYTQFKSRFTSLAQSLSMPSAAAQAQEIWLKVVTALQKTDAAYKAAPSDAKTGRKDLSSDAFQKIMSQFEPITAALGPYMEKYARGKKSWAFWSGRPAVEVAKKHAEICLEKSALGSLFDNININGSWDIQMWASLSKAYATHAAANVGKAAYRGFVGMGSSAEQSIFNKIEQPQFVGMLNEKAKATVRVDWYAVAGDPKTDMQVPDWRFKAGSLDGVYGTGDRAAMVALAESENKRRLELFKDKGIDEGPSDKSGSGASAEPTTFDPVVAHGTMEGTAHTLTVSKDQVILASAPAPLDVKVGTAKKNLKDVVAKMPSGSTKKADADKELARINKNLDKIKTRIKNIAVGKTDKRPAGHDPTKGGTANINLTKLARDLMTLAEDIMSAINTYGALFKIHELDDPIEGDRYPSPDVGLHTVKPSAKNAAIVAPDRLPRESHHVPNNELFQTLLEELRTVGVEVAKSNKKLGFKKKNGFRKLGVAMQNEADNLYGIHKKEGTGLSAILIHRITHQNLNGQVGTAVHSKGMAALIEQAIVVEEDKLNVEYERIMTATGLSVKPTNAEWKPYVDKCKLRAESATTASERGQATKDLKAAQAAETELKVLDSKEKNALERIAAAQIRPLLRTTFESSLGQVYNTLKTALGLSRVDGSEADKNAALSAVLKLAKQSWTPLTEAKFTVPDADLDY
jgi:hypothetical protein